MAGWLTGVGVLALAVPAAGQSVHGRVVDVETRLGVAGALIVALDSAGNPSALLLSRSDGSFAADLPSAGPYRFRTDRIGYASTRSDTVRLEPGDTIYLELRAPVNAVPLSGIEVEGSPRCELDPRSGEATARLWEETRKALEAATITAHRSLRFDGILFTREIDLDSTAIFWEDREPVELMNTAGFASPSADSLARHGYVQDDGGGGRVYYLPDARALLSETFLDTHCFGTRRSSDGSLVGLTFRPVRNDGPPEVEGTLWLDPATGALRSMEARFVGLSEDVVRGHLGGRLDFEQLAGGHWIVRRWMMRLPLIREEWRVLFLGKRKRLIGFEETGGEVIEVLSGTGEVIPSRDEFALRGVALDPVRDAPLAGAELFVAGIGLEARADSAGRFRIDGLPRGRHLVTLWHPWVDTLGLEPIVQRVTLPADGPVALETPAREEVLGWLCGQASADGVLHMVVWDPITQEPLDGAFVRVWHGRADNTWAITDELGRLYFCDLPPGATVRFYAELHGNELEGEIELSPSGFTLVELELGAVSRLLAAPDPSVTDSVPTGPDSVPRN